MNFICDMFVKFFDMTESERILYLIPLAVKEQNATLNFIEMMEMATIQSIRNMNGEIDKVKGEYYENS